MSNGKRFNRYSLPLRVGALVLLVLSLATMAAAALAVVYGIDQGYYQRDYNHYFDTPSCRKEAEYLAQQVWQQSVSASGLTRQEELDL